MAREEETRAAAAWTLAGLSAPAALSLAGLSWHWVLLGGALAAGYYTIIYKLCDRPLTQTVTAAFGRRAGRILLFLAMLWTVFAAGAAAAGADMAYPEDRMSVLAPACMLLLAAFGGWRGTDALLRASAALALVLGLLYGGLVLAAAAQVKAQWLAPWGSADQAAGTFVTLLAASSALFLPQGRGKLKKPALFLGAGAVLPAALAAVTSGCLSGAVAARAQAPFYLMSKSLRLLGILERLEPLVSAALLAGFFCLTGLLTRSAVETGAALWPQLPQRGITLAVCALAGGAAFLSRITPKAIQMAAAAIFWGVLPLAALVIVWLKKCRKNQKKGLDKPVWL